MVMFGKRKYFQYKCNLTKAVFPTRRDLLKFEQALSFQEEVIAAYTVAFETNAEAMARECIHPREKYNDLPSVVNDKKKAENISVDSTVVCAFGAEVSKMLKDCINHGNVMIVWTFNIWIHYVRKSSDLVLDANTRSQCKTKKVLTTSPWLSTAFI